MTTIIMPVIWIDHHEARVFHFSRTDLDSLVLHPHNPTRHIHHKANSMGSGHASEDQEFLHRVVESVEDAGAVLITGSEFGGRTDMFRSPSHVSVSPMVWKKTSLALRKRDSLDVRVGGSQHDGSTIW